MTVSQDPSVRTGYVGGTDIAHILNLEPYGCARRLWYQKSDVEKDRDFKITGPIVAGKMMEDGVAELVKEQTGWNIRRKKASADGHELQRVDRAIVGQERGPGVLEIKTVSDQAYWKWKREGVPLGYQLQVQWYMRVLGWKWACIAAFNRDSGALYLFEFDARPELMAAVAEQVDGFVQSVQMHSAPPWLEERDARCESCEWQPTCQMAEWANVEDGGLVQIEGVPQLISEYQHAKQIEKRAQAIQDRLRDGEPEAAEEWRRAGIDALLGDNEQARASADERVSFKVQESQRVDVDALKSRHPDAYMDCLKRSVSRPLRILKIKGAK